MNEHTNGREYFPKRANFHEVAEVREVQDRLNKRPRKALGYRTPEEVFHTALAEIGEAGQALPRP